MTDEHRVLITRIQMEYVEMPDLKLTLSRARRLWNLEPGLCEELLHVLVQDEFLAQRHDGTFMRRANRN